MMRLEKRIYTNVKTLYLGNGGLKFPIPEPVALCLTQVLLKMIKLELVFFTGLSPSSSESDDVVFAAAREILSEWGVHEDSVDEFINVFWGAGEGEGEKG
jgi:hypothetical protein